MDRSQCPAVERRQRARTEFAPVGAAVAVECVQAFLETDGVDPDEQVRVDELLALDE